MPQVTSRRPAARRRRAFARFLKGGEARLPPASDHALRENGDQKRVEKYSAD
jgi:hypothetical protein